MIRVHLQMATPNIQAGPLLGDQVAPAQYQGVGPGNLKRRNGVGRRNREKTFFSDGFLTFQERC